MRRNAAAARSDALHDHDPRRDGIARVKLGSVLAQVAALPTSDHHTNQYFTSGCCPLPTDATNSPAERLDRLEHHLSPRTSAALILIGEGAGWRGARQTGVPFTAPDHYGGPTSEASATIVRTALAEQGLLDDVILWNACMQHPHRAGQPNSNRAPSPAMLAANHALLQTMTRARFVVAVGRHAAAAVTAATGVQVLPIAHADPTTRAVTIRHPSFGGASEFRNGIAELASRIT